MGWGLRNSVGVAEEPITGGIYSVENSADQLQRQGTDIHEDDPGEEMNYHGLLNGSTENQGGNYGYPNCFALWGTSSNFPNKGNLTVGSQFALNPDSTLNDTTCAEEYVAPRLTFQVSHPPKSYMPEGAQTLTITTQAHTAPLDLLFEPDGTTAYLTFHGSWNRDDPVGYKLSMVRFANGSPVEPSDSTNSTIDILSNPDLTKCPDSCFRPVGLARDSQGRIFVSSDSTGEIYVLQRAEMSATGETGTSTSSASGTLITPTSSTSSNVAPRSTRNRPGCEALWMTGLAVALSVVLAVFFTLA